MHTYECARYELVGLAYLRRTCALKLLREPAHVCDTLVHAWVGVARSPDERIKERNIRLSLLSGGQPRTRKEGMVSRRPCRQEPRRDGHRLVIGLDRGCGRMNNTASLQDIQCKS